MPENFWLCQIRLSIFLWIEGVQLVMMKFRIMHFALAMVLAGVATHGAEIDSQSQLADIAWPRTYQSNGHEVVLYQPQLDEWDNFQRLRAKAALAVLPQGSSQPRYGAIHVRGKTATDFDSRKVRIADFVLERTHFPNLERTESDALERIVREVLPTDTTAVWSLDRILASLDKTQHGVSEVEVNLDPPPIHYSDSPAILMIFLGEPKFEPIEGTKLLFAVNTNWDVFMDLTSGNYFLLNGDSWLTTPDLLEGPWSGGILPSEFVNLPQDENWSDVYQHLAALPETVTPKVLVSYEPAEMILTDGPAKYTLISGTRLLQLSNSWSDVFLLPSDGNYYYLTAGRWFRSASLDGPWSAATRDLPGEFLKISSDHDVGHILSSVPGSPDAEAAVLLASVPKQVTIDRSQATVSIAYDGDPQFVEIQGTSGPVYYAVNTPNKVFRIKNHYYSCHEGVWFASALPRGPWAVAVNVPPGIYTIPTTHPAHNVTYVYVYDSTPTTVVVGYTAGYTGSYVAANVVMFGLGVWALTELHDHHHYHYNHAHYFSYGCGARYDYRHGGYYRGGFAYGPYGGAGRGAAYNPRTGTYARGAYRYGPRGGGFAREAYNPHTGRYAGQVGASNAYGSWGRSVVSDGKNWARAGHKSNWERSVVGFETSRGAAGVGAKNNLTGRSGFVGKNKYGDAYVGRDGNVYKRENGQWQKAGRGGWESPGFSGSSRSTEVNRSRVVSPERSSIARQPRQVQLGLDRQHTGRQLGNRNAGGFNSTRARRSGGFRRSGLGRR